MTYEGIVERVSSVMCAVREATPSEYRDNSIPLLLTDMRASVCTVVIAGEFNRGKSTLVNAILGQELLPCDVVPTTASIHVIRKAAAPVLQIHRRSGEVEHRSLTAEELRQFVACETGACENTSYLEIGLPLPQLDGIALVDTPGVDDMNRHRAEVTYSFVPRADVVLFVLDATTPVRRSEMDFLQSAILSSGIERLIFVANFADALDPDERSQALDSIRNRLRSALSDTGFGLFLISARHASEAVQKNDAQLMEESGLNRLMAEIDRLRRQGPAAQERAAQFVSRAEAIVRKYDATLEAGAATLQSSSEDVDAAIEKLEDLAANIGQIQAGLREWAASRRSEILAMTRKSLDLLSADLRSDVHTAIWDYNGPQFKQLVEDRIPRLVRHRFKVWIEAHAPSLRRALMQLNTRLCAAVSRYCKHAISSTIRSTSVLAVTETHSELSFTTDDVSFTTIKAGLVTAGAAGMLILLGAPVLVPLIGMAGLPLLSKLWSDRKLNEAKSRAIDETDTAIDASTSAFSQAVMNAISRDIDAITAAAERELERYLTVATERIRQEAANRSSQRSDLTCRRSQIAQARSVIADALVDLQNIRDCAPAMEKLTYA